jgi:hypothetical protein
MKEKGVVLNIRVDEELHAQIVRTVAQQMMIAPHVRYTKSDFVREAIIHFLRNKEKEIK